VFYWEGSAELVRSGYGTAGLAAESGRILLRAQDRNGETWFAVLELDPQPKIAATFKVEGTWGLLSPSASRAAVFGDTVYIADLTTGQIEPAGLAARRVQLPKDLRVTGQLQLKNTRDGKGFLLGLSSRETGFEGTWLSYSWTGELLAQGRGKEFQISPDGTLIAVREQWPGGSGASILSVFNTGNGAADFRIIGVGPTPRDLSGVNWWLADNSGILVSSSGDDRFFMMRDGSTRPAFGVPSPTSQAKFATMFAVVDGQGNQVSRARLSLPTTAFIPPWGESGDEMRFQTPAFGYDSGPTGSLVHPYLEEPPYAVVPLLRIKGEAIGLELWDAPAGTQVVGRLTSTAIASIHEARGVCSNPTSKQDPQCVSTGYEYYRRVARVVLPDLPLGPDTKLGGTWARVTTADGQEGWLLWSVSPWWL
jgi:hypothetical protein